MKQTIAWIGGDHHQGDILMKLAGHYRLLWVRRKEDLQTASFHDIPESEVEIIDCAKEGCWEADIIVLAGEALEDDLLEKIRDVATQKIALLITRDNVEGRQEEKLAQIREALPFSKTAAANFHLGETRLSGDNPAALSTASEILRRLGCEIGHVRHKT